MKKFLSLVLALAMTLSLVTISAGAKDFADSDELTSEQYEEAVNVMSEMGIIDGYSDGDFRPQGTLTRQAAAKIIACMMLGKTTAESLGTQAAPFKDVPAGSQFAGYIAFCVERGLIDGYADGTFRPTGTLTGFAFLKMLLGALGYDSSIEGYTGTNWTVNVAGRAYEIGLTDGNDEFVGGRAATREEAALYAVNTLKATLVEYADKGSSITINGAEIVTGASEPTYVTSSVYNAASSISADRDNEGMYTVEFAERYQPDLKLTPDTDDFMRPAHTWSWKSREIGTYMNYDELVAEYTTGVTGREMYNVLTATTIREYSLEAFLDGIENEEGTAATKIVAKNLTRSNDEDLGGTGNGVLTQVFVDNEDEEIIITSINTYLAQATADYSDSKEYAPLSVYTNKDGKTTSNFNVDVEDVPAVENVEDETFYLVNISKKYDEVKGEVTDIMTAEVLEDSTVTKWSDSDDGLVVDKLTTDGTQYNAAVKAYYDSDTLENYYESLLTDMTYNVYLDQYGYVIGVELYEGTLKYVFITGYDRTTSNLSVKTADAAAIFLDGTMDVIEVNVTDTNKNIRKADADDANNYFSEWSSGNRGGNPTLNRWYTYSQDEDGVYTLKPALQSFSTKTVDVPRYDAKTDEAVINSSNVRLSDSKGPNTQRAYGEDDSIFITVDQDVVDTTEGKTIAITEVNGTYTGVQNVDLEVSTKDVTGDWAIHTVYDDDNYIIASIVVGDASGAVANYAYILSGAKSEEKIGDTYYWEFDAVLDGEIQTLTAKSKTSLTQTDLKKGDVQELRFDADNYVVKIVDVPTADIYDYAMATDSKGSYDTADYEVYFVDSDDATDDELVLKLSGRTLYIEEDQSDYGLTMASDAKAVVIQRENGKTVKTEFESVADAIGRLAEPTGEDKTAGQQYQGEIIAVLNNNGTAAWVVFNNDSELVTGTNRPSQGNDDSDVRYVDIDDVMMTITLDKRDTPTTWDDAAEKAVEAAARRALNSIGYRAVDSIKWGNPATIDAIDTSITNPATFTFSIVWG